MIKIYHNPRCRKSREALALIRESGMEPEIVEYLKTPPSKIELKDMLEKMDMKPVEIIRKGEDIFKSSYKGKEFSDDEWLEILVENPKLIERPIVVKDEQVVLGRPPESVKRLL